MPKAICNYFIPKKDGGYCKLSKDLCGFQKWCRADNTFKLNDTCINCTLPKKRSEK